MYHPFLEWQQGRMLVLSGFLLLCEARESHQHSCHSLGRMTFPDKNRSLPPTLASQSLGQLPCNSTADLGWETATLFWVTRSYRLPGPHYRLSTPCRQPAEWIASVLVRVPVSFDLNTTAIVCVCLCSQKTIRTGHGSGIRSQKVKSCSYTNKDTRKVSEKKSRLFFWVCVPFLPVSCLFMPLSEWILSGRSHVLGIPFCPKPDYYK